MAECTILKETYTIDFTNVERYSDMHFIIREALDWPKYYSCNWDAFWDCLTNMLGRPIYIEIIGLEVIERKFGNASKMMVETLKEFKHYDNDEYVNDIRIDIISGETRVSLS